MKGQSEKHHTELLNGLYNQLEGIFDNSGQAIYLYLDDVHKLCNKKFANMLNYKSPKEWAESVVSFTDIFGDKKSQNNLVSAYHKAMEKMNASSIAVKWRKKNGRIVSTNVILVPISYNGHLFALHFVSKA